MGKHSILQTNLFLASLTKQRNRLLAILSAILLSAIFASFASAQYGKLPGERFSETRQRYIRAREMDKYTNDNLQYAINEMFARRRYLFQTRSLARFFTQFAWYRPVPYLTIAEAVGSMTPTELNNYRLFLATLRARRNGGGVYPPPQSGTLRFPQTASRNLTQTEIQNLSDANLRYALNEVYARHGYRFRDANTYQLFLRQPWYRPVTGQTKERTEARFNRFEVRNVQALNAEYDFRNGSDRGF